MSRRLDFGVSHALQRQRCRLDKAAEWLAEREVQMDRMRDASEHCIEAEYRAERAYWRARAWSLLAQAVWEAGRGDGAQKQRALEAVLQARRESRALSLVLWGPPV
jgi:hypothetical protein